jgi:hypothetical protein
MIAPVAHEVNIKITIKLSFAMAQFFARAKESAPYHRTGLEIVLRHALWGRMISPGVSSLAVLPFVTSGV